MDRFRSNLTPPRRRGFTMVELLVVMGIIALLAAALVTVSSGVWRKASAKRTLAMLQVVQQALDDFKRDPPVFVNKSQGEAGYKKRYGPYPPDELEVFTAAGLPGSEDFGQTLAPGKAKVVPGTGYQPMTFGRSPVLPETEHRDLAAMLLAIQLYSEKGRMILDRIESHYWTDGAADRGTGKPTQFLNRIGDDQWDEGDTQIRWLIDDWDNPLVYYAQRDWTDSTSEQESSNHDAWNQASTEMIRINGGQPIIMSYGPDGPDQLAGAAPAPETLLHVDWSTDRKINHPLNDDNIYPDPLLAEKLAKGIPTP